MATLGPLTKAMTPSSGCNSVIYGYVHTQFNPANLSDSTTHKYHSLGLPSTSECYPPGFLPTSEAYYSPGVCPSGWASACGTVEVIGSMTETRATCCPRGYTCIDPPEATETWSTLSCSSIAISAVNVTVPYLDNQGSMVTELVPLIFAAAINVRWQRDDFVIASSTPPPTSTSTSSASVSSSSTVPTSANTPVLSLGATIGIGVGAGVGGLLILGAVGFFLRRRKTSGRGTAKVEPEPLDQEGKPEMAGHHDHNPELPTQSNTAETDGRIVYPEMYTTSNVAEMDGISKPSEATHR